VNNNEEEDKSGSVREFHWRCVRLQETEFFTIGDRLNRRTQEDTGSMVL
jgi:hypothetical protein